jgi:Fe-S-cluster containining protein
MCCKNLSVGICRPRTKTEIEDLKWQLQFDTVSVYIRNNRWYQLIEGRCIYLSPDDRCTRYNDRPEVCRRHNPPNCEFFGEFYDVMIDTPEELDAYLEKRSRRVRKVA